MIELSEPALAGIYGLCGGVVLGLAARRGGFCTLGAIEDALYARDYERARMWGVALFAAIAGVAGLTAAGVFNPAETVYAKTMWNPWASIVGGGVFGYGMALAGNCGFGALSRMGGGDMRSFVVIIVMGVSAYMVLVGPLAPIRLAVFPVDVVDAPAAGVSIAESASRLTGVSPFWIALVVASGFLAVALRGAGPDQARRAGVWGFVVGGAVVAGWWGASHLHETGFDRTPVESHTFTTPLGESLLYLMTSEGGGAGFSVGSVTGVLLGAFLGCFTQGRFQWEACDDPRELGRQLIGAVMMGVGGVVALGCSIGQGLTAFSTLAWSAPVVAASIFAGAALGLRHLIEGRPSFRLFLTEGRAATRR